MLIATEIDVMALSTDWPAGTWNVNGIVIVNRLPKVLEVALSNQSVAIGFTLIVNWEVGIENPGAMENCTAKDVRDRVVVKPVT